MKQFLLEDKRFYVYIYFDIRKFGNYQYDDYNFNFEPFYIGKGHGKRYLAHLESSDKFREKNKTRHLYNTISKLIRLNQLPQIKIIKENLTDVQAQKLEIDLIKLIGRKDLKKGPLLNATDGGEGTSKRIISEETRKKMRTSLSGENSPFYGKHLTEKHKLAISIANKGKRRTEKQKKYMSSKRKLIGKGRKCPEHSKKMLGSNNPMFGKKRTEQTKQKISSSLKSLKLKKAKYLYDLIDSNGIEHKNVLDIASFCEQNNLKMNTVRQKKYYKNGIFNYRGWKIFQKEKYE